MPPKLETSTTLGTDLNCFSKSPIFDRLQFHQVVFGIAAPQRVPVDLTNRAPIGTHLRLQAVWQSYLRQPLQYFLPIPIVVGFVVENQHYAGQAEERSRAKM